MATQQWVEIKVKLPVEVFDAFQSNNRRDVSAPAIQSASKAVWTAVERAHAHHQISIFLDDDTEVQMWVSEAWKIWRVWQELYELHGINRNGQRLSLNGSEVHANDTVRDYNIRHGTILFVVEANFFEAEDRWR